MRKSYLILFLLIIVSLGVFLRIYKIDQIPPGINRDEGSIGYTAYSLLKTGKDEYGRMYPLSFESFGDWKLPLYIYATSFFVSIFGMSEVSLRLLSILAGILAIILTYFLAYKLTKNHIISILTSFLLAVSPWHLHLSRVESEANTSVMFIILAVLLFFKGLEKKPLFFIPAAIFFAASYYTYAGSNIFTTFLIGGITLLYRSKIPHSKISFLSAFLFILLFSIITYQTLFGASSTKFSGISIFSDPSVVFAKIETPRLEHLDNKELFVRLAHNKPVYAIEQFVKNYLNAFSPQFLFIKGGSNSAHNIENMGNMYLFESIFFYFGTFFLIFKKNKSKEEMLILFWLFISPIAASITKDAPHTNRMLSVLPILPLTTAIGMHYGFQLIPKSILRNIAIGLFSFVFLLNVFIYLDRYFVHFPKNEVKNWGFGYKYLNTILQKEEYKTKNVIMSNPQYSHYIYLLFYQKYDPLKYQKEAVRYPYTEDKFLHVKEYGRFEFRDINFDKDTKLPNTLLVAFPQEIPDRVKKQFHSFNITFPNGDTMFTVVDIP